MLYSEDGIEIKTADDWRRQLKDYEKNWAEGKSAYEITYTWLDAGGSIPKRLTELLNTSAAFQDLSIDKAIAEKKTRFDTFGEPSHTDLMIYGKTTKGPVVIAVEGKESEDFDKTVAEWLTTKREGSNKPARLENLLEKLTLKGLDRERIEKLRYQLLHRTLSALIEAKAYDAKNAMMLIHSFLADDMRDHFDDYVYFCNLLGIDRSSISRNKISGPVVMDKVSMYFGWLRDQKRGQR